METSKTWRYEAAVVVDVELWGSGIPRKGSCGKSKTSRKNKGNFRSGRHYLSTVCPTNTRSFLINLFQWTPVAKSSESESFGSNWEISHVH
uniref:Uncharacterized protein n=1 Tax=Salix viminalis TaxID=40686 RepID=A0A6N2KRQ8_SALVM